MHELEIEKVEVQSKALLKEHEVRRERKFDASSILSGEEKCITSPRAHAPSKTMLNEVPFSARS